LERRKEEVFTNRDRGAELIYPASATNTLIGVDACTSLEGAEKQALGHAAHIFGQVRPLLLLELHNPECDQAAWNFSRYFNYELTSLDTEEVLTKAERVQGTLLCSAVKAGAGHQAVAAASDLR
jgi:hypothetical protein